MENLENVDQNQLALFELLTAEQEVRKAGIIANRAVQAKRVFDKDARIESLLLEAGFVRGTHFKSNSKIVKSIIKIDVGEYKNEKIVDVEVENAEGHVSILYDRLNNTIIEKVTAYVWMNDECRLECSAVTGTNRAYKPKSLFDKLMLKNQKAIEELEAVTKNISVKEYTLQKYKTLFPEAVVELGRDYTNYSSGYNRTKYVHFDTLSIKFKSGSQVVLRVGPSNDTEQLHKKYDAVIGKQSILETLTTFNNQ
jgi:hypothetical protein